MVTNGTDLKLGAIDTSRNKKEKKESKSTGPSDDGIGKYLFDVEKVIVDEDFLRNYFHNHQNIRIVGIDLGEVCTAAACAILIDSDTGTVIVFK
jgi:hypothetical protein